MGAEREEQPGAGAAALHPSWRVCAPFSSLGKVSYVAVLVCILQKGEMRLGEVVT